MMSLHKRLLFSAAPRSDESFIGYLLRLADLNDYETLSWILQAAEIKAYARSSFSFALNGSLNLSPLAQLTGVNEAELTPLLYHPTKELRGRMVGEHLVFGSAVPQYLIRLRHPKVCTECLRESGYTRRIWDLAPVTVCPVHKRLLLDSCPQCQKRISWNRPGISLCRCKFDWRNHTTVEIPSSELEVTRQIYRLCKLPLAITQAEPSGRISNDLINLELLDFLAALSFVASQFEGIMDTKGKHLAPNRTNTQLHELFCKSWPVFCDWPENFFLFLDWRRLQNAQNKDNGLTGWQKDFSEYKSTLFVQLSPPQFDFMRTAFREYVDIRRRESYIENAQLNSCSTSQVGRSPKTALRERGKGDYMSAIAARKALKISWHSINRLIATEKLRAIVSSRGGSRVFLIERKSVDELKIDLDGALFLKQVAAALGLSTERIKELIEGGVLRSIRDPGIDGRSDKKFSHREVLGVLDEFEKRVPSGKSPRSGKEVKSKALSFNDTLRKVGRVNISLSTFVQSVLDGLIKPCGKCKKAGLQQFLFSEAEISEYAQRTLSLQTNGALSLAEVSRQLGVTRAIVSVLLKKKFLPAQKLPNLEALGQLVTKEDFELFNTNYVLIAKEAKKLKTTSLYIVDLLVAQGVHPVSGTKDGGKTVYLFRKTDVGQVNLESLVSRAKAEHQSSRIKSGTTLPSVLSSAQVAEALEIDLQTVLQLAESGILKPYNSQSSKTVQLHSDQDYYFSAYVVEKYRSQSIDYSGLISAAVAARMLDKTLSSFYQKYVNTLQLIATVADGMKGNLYFKRAEVEALAETEKQKIKSGEVAAILGVNISCVDKLTVSGDLRPVSGPGVDGFGYNLYLRDDVERLREERDAFKAACIKEGRTTRFGKPAGPKARPVQDVIGPRIDRLSEKWQERMPDRRITGERLYQQLIKEGYRTGINAVYVYLRQKQRQVA